ncbi:site-specific DNA-methyltransferase [Helicobacter himalayensis]|uniref:site-specific DNA-methyltransferase n=1 Tax=Helicobacter himalayensis TaxID=1591088 RepID=UPI003D6E3E91
MLLYCPPPYKLEKLSLALQSNPNLLIKGNNLIALHSLKKNPNIYGKVKLIYIDPPYNTGNDSFNYNDNFTHSTYLSFMKSRLEIAREFLREDGVIFIQCDDNEQAYLKVLCDEIFGRENFDSCVSHIVKPEGRMYGNIAKTHEYILIYAKNHRILEFDEIDKKNHIFEFKDEYGGFDLKNLENGNFRKFNDSNRPNLRFDLFVNELDSKNGLHSVAIDNISCSNKLIKVSPSSKNNFNYVWRWSKEKCANELHNLCARKSANGEYLIFQKIRKNTTKAKSIFWDKEMITQKGTKEIKALFTPLCHTERSEVSQSKSHNGDFSATPQNDNSAQEMLEATPLFSTPKPEALLKRIIEISTKEGDLVLDFFAGSGTTLAVAHKMGRKWVGIEQMEYCESITKARLQKVVSGEQGGISKAVGFSGGGSFVYCELMPLNAMYKAKIDALLESKELDSANELNALYENLSQKAFIDYRADIHKILKDSDFNALEREEKLRILRAILDSNMDYVPYGEIDDTRYEVSETVKTLNAIFYGEKQ